jgi:hypothetical protein
MAAAAQLPSFVPQFLGSNSTNAFVPGKIFEFNIPGLIHYLAAAIKNGASFEDVAPAWKSFLLAFPYKLVAQTVQWFDLLFVGKIIAQLQRTPLELVAQKIHQMIADEFSKS